MNLLFITRKVDNRDALAGFAHAWVGAFANHVDHLYVITWQASAAAELPSNVTIISLVGGSLSKVWQIQKKIVSLRSNIDVAICHMNPEYAIVAAPLLRLFRRPVYAWYTHKAITLRRRLMELLVNGIFTASRESFRGPLFPRKVQVTGHGIDTDVFVPPSIKHRDGAGTTLFKLLTVGRLSPVKRVERIIEATALLPATVHLTVVGDTLMQHQASYAARLRTLAEQSGLGERVAFLGWVPHAEAPAHYQAADLFISLSQTGSLDKAVLEAMACGSMVMTSNEAFKALVPAPWFLESDEPEVLAARIREAVQLSPDDRSSLGQRLRDIVVRDHSLQRLARNIVDICKKKQSS